MSCFFIVRHFKFVENLNMYLSKYVFYAFTLPAIFFISCSKDIVPLEAPLNVEEEAEPVPVETFIEGKILSPKAELCLWGRDEAMHGVIKRYCGNSISVLLTDGESHIKFVPDEKTVISTPSISENTDHDSSAVAQEKSSVSVTGTEYVHVVYDSMDFWLEKNVFALNCENAVAIEKTFLYSDMEMTQKIDSPQNPLRFASQIALATDSELSDTSETVKIYYYDSKIKSVAEAFVAASSISSRIDDIVVSQIAEELKVTKRAVPRNELFARAAKYKPCKKVLAQLNAQKVETKTYNYQEVLQSLQKMSFGVNVEELMTVDQSKDPFK